MIYEEKLEEALRHMTTALKKLNVYYFFGTNIFLVCVAIVPETVS